MRKYSRDEFSDALQVVSSTISKCEKIQPKFAERTSQYTLESSARYALSTFMYAVSGIGNNSATILYPAMNGLSVADN